MKKHHVEGAYTMVDNKRGLWMGLGAYFLWGILPIYWKLLSSFRSETILCFRIFHAAILLVALALVRHNLKDILAVLKDRKKRYLLILASILITINWGVYIGAVNAGFIVESSLGYYINPLVSVLLGVFVLKERFHIRLGISLGFAIIGVGIMTVGYGRIPWIALILAVSFALYGLVKKQVGVDSVTGLTLETLLIFPFAVGGLIVSAMTTGLTKQQPSLATILLSLLAGLITAVPLLMFGIAARSLSLTTLGFLQYFSPTLQLLVGVLIYRESFTLKDFIAFSFIWCGLLIYSSGQIKEMMSRRSKPDELF